MNDIERINALTTNARNTWFVLITALVFVGITLMSTKPTHAAKSRPRPNASPGPMAATMAVEIIGPMMSHIAPLVRATMANGSS